MNVETKKTGASQLPRLKERLKRLMDLYEIGDMDFDEYKNKRMEIINKIDAIEKEPTQKVRQLPSNWKDLYNALDVPHKRAFWAHTLDHIEINGMCCKNPIIFF